MMQCLNYDIPDLHGTPSIISCSNFNGFHLFSDTAHFQSPRFPRPLHRGQKSQFSRFLLFPTSPRWFTLLLNPLLFTPQLLQQRDIQIGPGNIKRLQTPKYSEHSIFVPHFFRFHPLPLHLPQLQLPFEWLSCSLRTLWRRCNGRWYRSGHGQCRGRLQVAHGQ